MRTIALYVLSALTLEGCTGGNVEASANSRAPKAPPLLHSDYDPYAAYGSSKATWTPPVANRDGTIVRPADPEVSLGRADYEHSQWATGAAGGAENAPPGTF